MCVLCVHVLVCEQCKAPYFAGARACGANDQEINRMELLCSGFVRAHSLVTVMLCECVRASARIAPALSCASRSSQTLCTRACVHAHSCQKVESLNACPTHGDGFLIFKCRFCCNFSTWFCFGKTHFCDACHNGNVWPTLV